MLRVDGMALSMSLTHSSAKPVNTLQCSATVIIKCYLKFSVLLAGVILAVQSDTHVYKP